MQAAPSFSRVASKRYNGRNPRIKTFWRTIFLSSQALPGVGPRSSTDGIKNLSSPNCVNRVNPAGTLSCNKVATKSRREHNVSDSQSFPPFYPFDQCHFFPVLDKHPEERQVQGQGRQLPGLRPQPPGLCRGLWPWRAMLSLLPSQVSGQPPVPRPLSPLQRRGLRRDWPNVLRCPEVSLGQWQPVQGIGQVPPLHHHHPTTSPDAAQSHAVNISLIENSLLKVQNKPKMNLS